MKFSVLKISLSTQQIEIDLWWEVVMTLTSTMLLMAARDQTKRKKEDSSVDGAKTEQ